MILEKLREHTSVVHRELEALVRIEEATASAAQYRVLLKNFFGFYKPMEARLTSALAKSTHGYSPDQRLKAPWLKADLQELGLRSEDIAQLPVCEDLPETTTAAYAFGCAYVIEGATLGGRFIARMIEAAPDRDQLPHRFFTAYGSDVGTRWKDFCESIERFASENPTSISQILIGAEQTFKCLQVWVR